MHSVEASMIRHHPSDVWDGPLGIQAPHFECPAGPLNAPRAPLEWSVGGLQTSLQEKYIPAQKTQPCAWEIHRCAMRNTSMCMHITPQCAWIMRPCARRIHPCACKIQSYASEVGGCAQPGNQKFPALRVRAWAMVFPSLGLAAPTCPPAPPSRDPYFPRRGPAVLLGF